jgi:hypothetical protein
LRPTTDARTAPGGGFNEPALAIRATCLGGCENTAIGVRSPRCTLAGLAPAAIADATKLPAIVTTVANPTAPAALLPELVFVLVICGRPFICNR